MNDHDKENLNFILNASNETLKDWYKTLDPDDIGYAQELLTTAALEVDMRIIELHDNMIDVSDANAVLNKYRLNK